MKDLPTGILRPIVDDDVLEIKPVQLSKDGLQMAVERMSAVVVRAADAKVHDPSPLKDCRTRRLPTSDRPPDRIRRRHLEVLGGDGRE